MRSILLSAAAITCVASAAPVYAASTETVLYAFTAGNDGGFPQSGLIADSTGALYGTTSSDGANHSGVVYKLTPPAAGQTAWTQTVLYAFLGGNDGATPLANLLLDKNGNLYGTTYAGGAPGEGVVFQLKPPSAGNTNWTESVLYTFSGGADGSEPASTLIADRYGNLYGTTTGGGTGVVGTVFKLTPPSSGRTAWTESVLYNFTGNNDGGEPFGAVLQGKDGAFYGTTAGYAYFNYGNVYKLNPPTKTHTAWRLHVVHAFAGGNDGGVPRAGLISDSAGILYGTTAGFANFGGTAFKITPPAAGTTIWHEQVLTQFATPGFTGVGPWAPLSQDSTGALYGTTLASGTSAFGEVFKLTPPAAGKKHWTNTALYTFKGGAASQFSYSNVVLGTGGTLFGTTEGAVNANTGAFVPGNIWEITQ